MGMLFYECWRLQIVIRLVGKLTDKVVCISRNSHQPVPDYPPTHELTNSPTHQCTNAPTRECLSCRWFAHCILHTFLNQPCFPSCCHMILEGFAYSNVNRLTKPSASSAYMFDFHAFRPLLWQQSNQSLWHWDSQSWNPYLLDPVK